MDMISEASSCVFVLMMEIVEVERWKEKRVKLEQNQKMETVFQAGDSCRWIVTG